MLGGFHGRLGVRDLSFPFSDGLFGFMKVLSCFFLSLGRGFVISLVFFHFLLSGLLGNYGGVSMLSSFVSHLFPVSGVIFSFFLLVNLSILGLSSFMELLFS